MEPYDVAIIGAGPVGLEAGARAADLGLRAVIFEAGEVGEYVDRWGHVRLFTPLGMNIGPAGARLLARTDGRPGAPDDAILTGREFRECALLPLAAALGSKLDLRTGTRVRDVARLGFLKSDAPGSPARGERPFRLLVDGPREEEEEELRAHHVLDASGTYGNPNWAGPGGAPARGERALRDTIEYGLPDVTGAARTAYASGRTLLIGAGHSAATTGLGLAELADDGARFLWISRGAASAPLRPIPDDSLPERARLVERANALAAAPPPGCEWVAEATLAAVRREDEAFSVALDVGGAERVERVDRIVANVGYEPDDSVYRQLQIHECYASRGPMRLSAALLAAAGGGRGDCLELGGFGPESLDNPEPGFFIIGAKSYGRNPAFLLRTGYEQVRDAMERVRAPEEARHIRL